MSDTSRTHGAAQAVQGDYRAVRLHHVSHHVPDLEAADAWVQKVFRRPPTPIAEILSRSSASKDFPQDYSTYYFIADLMFDVVAPDRFVLGGEQRAKSVVEPHLKSFGWYIDGMPELFPVIRQAGIRLMDTPGDIIEGERAPVSANGDPAPYHSIRKDAGLRYQFYPANMTFPDPRREEGWVEGVVDEADPLGIIRCSHHTILTSQPDRALGLLVDVLGGTVLGTARDELWGSTSTFVHLAGSTFEYAVPDAGTPAHAELMKEDPRDSYYAITWHVTDLDRSEQHLAANGVGIRDRSDDTFVTDPATSLHIPWRFSTKLVDGDPRQG